MYNERSWAIDLIAHIKTIVDANNRAIKNAGGEQTIRADGGSLFPDVLLFGDRSTAKILQGWELKMPDTSIDDITFHRDAARKARALGLNSFVLWNVTSARLYASETRATQYTCKKQWPTLDHIVDRESVQIYRNDWKQFAGKVLMT